MPGGFPTSLKSLTISFQPQAPKAKRVNQITPMEKLKNRIYENLKFENFVIYEIYEIFHKLKTRLPLYILNLPLITTSLIFSHQR